MGGEFDYIVVGAGSAGCVVANRLSANAKNRVLLIEAGPADKNIWLHIPAGVSRVFMDPKVNWVYSTEPEPHLDGRKVYWPRGKTLGGSSAINGMAYMRGHPADYDAWAQAGNAGWGADNVLHYFKKSEKHIDGASKYHGADGDLSVTHPVLRYDASKVFLEGASQVGIESTADFNGERQEGAGWIQFHIENGRRASSAVAFLKPVLSRSNLAVETDALVERIDFDNRRASGVTYRCGGRTIVAKASAEVILCGGVINSPQLLMLSGIGPAEELARHGIGVVQESAMVGRNLQDHLYVHHVCEVERGYSINGKITGPGLVPQVLNYFLRRKGPLAMGFSNAGVFARVMPDAAHPDAQISFRPFSITFLPNGKLEPHPFPGVSASMCFLRPYSRGHVALKSSNPADAPAIFANYLSDPRDMTAMMEGFRKIEEIYASPAMSKIVKRMIAPEAHAPSDEALMAYIRANSQSMYHPVGTCMMSAGDEGVVDPSLKVRGVSGLRIADASIMPNIVSGNTCAPSIMIGEKAADMILSGGR